MHHITNLNNIRKKVQKTLRKLILTRSLKLYLYLSIYRYSYVIVYTLYIKNYIDNQPVRFHISQVSTVPKQQVPFFKACCTTSTLSASHLSLTALK